MNDRLPSLDKEARAFLDHLAINIYGETESDDRRHIEMRNAFMALLLPHMAREGIFQHWIDVAELQPLMEDAHRLGNRLWRLQQLGATCTRRDYAALDKQWRSQLVEVRMRLLRAGPFVASEVARYVGGLNIYFEYKDKPAVDWAWLGNAIVEHWTKNVLAYAQGADKLTITHKLNPADPTAPHIPFAIKPEPEESTAAFSRRVDEWYADYRKKLDAEMERQNPKGRPDQRLDNPDKLKVLVELFFRIAVLRETPYEVGQYEMNGHNRNPTMDDTNVKRRAKEVRHWLGLGYTAANAATVVERMLADPEYFGGHKSETDL